MVSSTARMNGSEHVEFAHTGPERIEGALPDPEVTATGRTRLICRPCQLRPLLMFPVPARRGIAGEIDQEGDEPTEPFICIWSRSAGIVHNSQVTRGLASACILTDLFLICHVSRLARMGPAPFGTRSFIHGAKRKTPSRPKCDTVFGQSLPYRKSGMGYVSWP